MFRHIETSNDITIIWLIYRKVLVRFEPNETSLENSFNYKIIKSTEHVRINQHYFFYLQFDTESSSERDYFAFGTQRCLIIINYG